MSKRNKKIALAYLIEKLPTRVIADQHSINVSRVHQIVNTIKGRFGWFEGIHPNIFSKRLAEYDSSRYARCNGFRLETPEQMYFEILSEERQRINLMRYGGNDEDENG